MSLSALVAEILWLIDWCRTTFQWMFWGYSLAFSRDAGPFIGSLSAFGMKNVLAAPSPGSTVLPEIVYCLYQLLFCACTVHHTYLFVNQSILTIIVRS
jgi:ammonia channel protein AmtB